MYEIMEELQKGGHTTGRSTRKNTQRKTQLFNMFIEKGWDPVFLRKQFRNLGDTMFKEWSPNMFIEHWAKQYIRYYGLRRTIQTTLLSLGLTRKKTNELVPMCRSLLGSSYSRVQLIDIAIEYAVGKYDPIKWIYFTREAKKHTSLLQIRSVCLISLEPQLQTLLNDIPREKETTELYFHTTSWGSCLSILNGISHGIGRECLDFGLRPGFYLSQDIRVALDWGYKKSKFAYDQIGIIVFCLPKRFPDTLKRKHLTGREWKDVTYISRKCKKQPLELEQLSGYDFVYGDMVGNLEDIEFGIRPEPHTPAKLQLVSKSAKGDVYLQEHIVKCIYFDPR